MGTDYCPFKINCWKAIRAVKLGERFRSSFLPKSTLLLLFIVALTYTYTHTNQRNGNTFDLEDIVPILLFVLLQRNLIAPDDHTSGITIGTLYFSCALKTSSGKGTWLDTRFPSVKTEDLERWHHPI